MPTDLFSRAHESFLLSLNNVRFRYEPESDRLRLYVDRMLEIPPAWVYALRVEVVDEHGGLPVVLDLAWDDVEDSLLTATCACPEAFRPQNLSRESVPIGEVIFSAGAGTRRLPNRSSPVAFAARKPSPDPNEDYI